MISSTVLLWIGFSVFVLAMMVLDLGVFHRRAHATTLREAAIWTVVWVVMALLFCAVIYWFRGRADSVKFLTGYIIEWSLSMDNVFVFAVIFSYFAVPPQYQHRCDPGRSRGRASSNSWLARNSTTARTAGGGDDGCCVCGGLDSGDLCYYT
jgi:predicted tellurium resistance membrane protein TerC